MMQPETFHCLILSLVPGLGTARIHELIRRFGSAGAVTRLCRADLRPLALGAEIEMFLAGGCARKEAERAVQQAEKKRIRIVSFTEPEYPQLLKEIFDPPLILYCLGDLGTACRPGLALVGSRRCSLYGRQVTEKLARQVAQLGLNVVSGLARGIDSSAHRGALEAGGTTTAVLGSGVDVIYPRENRSLYERILQTGAILSEFPPGTFPAPQNFPIRNRIISGLCYGTVICEASEFSGSLITARLTLEQNRELFAVPGNITSGGSYGPNYLIKQGAKIVMTEQDIVDELPIYVLDFLARDGKAAEPGEEAKSSPTLNAQEGKVLKLLPADASRHFDWLLGQAALEFSELTEALFGLEMKGLIRQQPGRHYCRKLL